MFHHQKTSGMQAGTEINESAYESEGEILTREEAVAVLKAFIENPLFSEVHKAAFNIAIHDIKQRHDWDINNLILINKDNYEALEQEPTTKNDLGVDCVARQDVERFIEGFINEYTPEEELEFINLELDGLKHLPSVTPQEPQTFKWCETCKEYDQEKHCCHRWSKVIRDTVEEMKQEQEPILKKIRAEIDNALSDGMIHKKTVLGIIDKYKAETENT